MPGIRASISITPRPTAATCMTAAMTRGMPGSARPGGLRKQFAEHHADPPGKRLMLPWRNLFLLRCSVFGHSEHPALGGEQGIPHVSSAPAHLPRKGTTAVANRFPVTAQFTRIKMK